MKKPSNWMILVGLFVFFFQTSLYSSEDSYRAELQISPDTVPINDILFLRLSLENNSNKTLTFRPYLSLVNKNIRFYVRKPGETEFTKLPFDDVYEVQGSKLRGGSTEIQPGHRFVRYFVFHQSIEVEIKKKKKELERDFPLIPEPDRKEKVSKIHNQIIISTPGTYQFKVAITDEDLNRWIHSNPETVQVGTKGGIPTKITRKYSNLFDFHKERSASFFRLTRGPTFPDDTSISFIELQTIREARKKLPPSNMKRLLTWVEHIWAYKQDRIDYETISERLTHLKEKVEPIPYEIFLLQFCRELTRMGEADRAFEYWKKLHHKYPDTPLFEKRYRQLNDEGKSENKK